MRIIVSIFDNATKSYTPPVYSVAKGEAIRSFMDLLDDQNSQYAKHPEDFSLFYLGTFDESTGMFKTVNPEKLIGLWETRELKEAMS